MWRHCRHSEIPSGGDPSVGTEPLRETPCRHRTPPAA
nr:MAG TPA: hypothetical protein [Caudoviricetes sp.]